MAFAVMAMMGTRGSPLSPARIARPRPCSSLTRSGEPGRSQPAIIAAIAGACTGGGAGIAACCDIRIGTESTRMGFPIARTLGNCLSMSNISRLVSLIGPARTKDLIFKARLVEAQEALELGLLNEIVPDVTVLQRRAEETAKLVASHSPITLEVTKEAVRRIRRTLSRDEGEDLILRAYMSEDFREGMDAFLNKRTPNWKGR